MSRWRLRGLDRLDLLLLGIALALTALVLLALDLVSDAVARGVMP